MAATVLCASAAKSDKTHAHPETAEQERKQTLSTKRGPGGSVRLPRLAAHGGLPGPGSHRLPLRKPSSGWGPGAEEEMTARGQRTRRCAHPRLLAGRPDARARLLLAPGLRGLPPTPALRPGHRVLSCFYTHPVTLLFLDARGSAIFSASTDRQKTHLAAHTTSLFPNCVVLGESPLLSQLLSRLQTGITQRAV